LFRRGYWIGAKTFWNKKMECMPLEKLIELQNKKLVEGRVIERAYRSSLYSKKWKEYNIKPEKIRNRNDLKKLPFVTGANLKKTFTNSEIEDFVCTKNIRLWFSTSGTTGTPKWIPYSDNEIKVFEESVLRAFFIYADKLLEKYDYLKALLISTPAPFVSDGLVYFNLFADVINDIHLEHIIVSFSTGSEGLQLANARKLHCMLGFPSIAMKTAEVIEERVPKLIEEEFKKKKTLKNLIALFLTKIKKITPKVLFKPVIGVYGGETLDPYREAIIRSYGLEPFELYAFTEFPCAFPECDAHDGVHVWMDLCICEIIPAEELDKEEANLGYKPKTVFLDEAEPGIEGELVITTFSEALPLIRYRTSDLVRVISTKTCSCGRTHPRVKVLQRRDDLVNLGLIRLSSFDLDKKLAKVEKYGKVKKWQMRIIREGYKPRPLLFIEGVEIKNNAEFIKEINEKINEIEVFRKGVEENLVLKPDIRLVDQLQEKRTHTGKLRHIIYE
jgi:phenylacetate-CoA ligase